jgi:hypothetical protein
MVRASSTTTVEEDCIEIIVGYPEGKRPQRRPRRRWVSIINMDREPVLGGVGWIALALYKDRYRTILTR